MRTTFLNDNDERNLSDIARENMKRVSAEFEFWMEHGLDRESSEHPELFDENDITDFHDFGLSFDYVPKDSEKTDSEGGYFRYQIAWGGPSYEVRFYSTHTEYAYLDWFVGVGFDVSEEDWAKWLRQLFEEIGSIDWAKANEEDHENWEM